jgi:hypothetical protein
MKTRRILCAFALALLLTGAIPARAQAQSDNPLHPLAWMAGGTWRADAPQGPDGKPFHAEWKCRWGANHRTLDFTVWFLTDGKLVPVYNGLYAWHPGRKKLIFVYADNRGNLTEGEAVMNGERLQQDFHIVSADGVARPFRSIIVRQGPDAYDWHVQRKKDGAWTEMFALKYKRSRT